MIFAPPAVLVAGGAVCVYIQKNSAEVIHAAL